MVVLGNQTQATVHFVVIAADAGQSLHDLRPGQVLPVPTTAEIGVAIIDGPRGPSYRLRPNGIYCFQTKDGKTELSRHPLPVMPPSPIAASNVLPANKPPCMISVKIVVDDKEPTVQRIWEKRYRQRLSEASEIIERHCQIRLAVVAVAMWRSDSRADKMETLLREFEREVAPTPAQLAIGFTGQYHTLRDDKHMGGTRGAFCPHILIREWGRQLADAERLEILVHELGHYLGAVHSAERQSVMRPDIGDRQSRARSFQIGFDVENTLAMCLISEELRNRRLQHLAQLSPTTRDQLRSLYRFLAITLPDDPAARGFLSLLDRGQTPRNLPDTSPP